jgi:CHAD domain-containing protein
MNARLQHRAASPRSSSSHAKSGSGKPSEFERICEALDGYFDKAFEARKRLLEQPYEPKLLHAWRVNLRRVTATLKDLASLSDDDLRDVLAYLRSCRESTGQSRDLDILAQETLPAFLDKENVKLPGVDAATKALSERQQQAHKQAVVELKKHNLAASLQSWRHWVQTVEPPTDNQVRKLAAAALQQRWNTLKKRASKLDGGQKRLHRLRSATKKMRYSIELYQHAFSKQATSAWLKQLTELQSGLGLAHDRMTGRRLIRDFLVAEDTQTVLKPFRQWGKRTAFHASEEAMHSLAKLEKLNSFWRKAAH